MQCVFRGREANFGRCKDVGLSQVACCASVHFMVSKESAADVTTTSVSRLDTKSRIGEIARMLGGGELAEKHAAAMLRRTAPRNTGV